MLFTGRRQMMAATAAGRPCGSCDHQREGRYVIVMPRTGRSGMHNLTDTVLKGACIKQSLPALRRTLEGLKDL